MTGSQNLPESSHKAGLPAMTKSVDASLRRLADEWSMALPVPAAAVPHLPAAIAHAEAGVEPCGMKGASVMLMDLWAIYPMPQNSSADRIWAETLGMYPADLIRAAIARLISTRTWDRDAPVPANVISLMKDEHAERVRYLSRFRTMQAKARIEAKSAKPQSRPVRDQPEEDREAFLARLREKYPEGFARASAEVGE